MEFSSIRQVEGYIASAKADLQRRHRKRVWASSPHIQKADPYSTDTQKVGPYINILRQACIHGTDTLNSSICGCNGNDNWREFLCYLRKIGCALVLLEVA